MAREDQVVAAAHETHAPAGQEPGPGPLTTSDPSPAVVQAAGDEHPWSGEPFGYSGNDSAPTGQSVPKTHSSPPADTSGDLW